jgi:hypothetical protein
VFTNVSGSSIPESNPVLMPGNPLPDGTILR